MWYNAWSVSLWIFHKLSGLRTGKNLKTGYICCQVIMKCASCREIIGFQIEYSWLHPTWSQYFAFVEPLDLLLAVNNKIKKLMWIINMYSTTFSLSTISLGISRFKSPLRDDFTPYLNPIENLTAPMSQKGVSWEPSLVVHVLNALTTCSSHAIHSHLW